MPRMKFTAGTRYQMNQQMYLIQRPLTGGTLLVENLTMGTQERPTQEELYMAWQRGELRFAAPKNLAPKDATEENATRFTVADFGTLPKRYRDEAWRRYELLLPLLKLPRSERTRSAIKAHATTLQATNPTRADPKHWHVGQVLTGDSLERWLRNFERSGWDIRALVPGYSKRGDQGKSHLDTEMQRLVQSTLEECALKPAHRTLKDVHYLLANKVADVNRHRADDQKLILPVLSTVYERIQVAGPAGILRRRPSRLEEQAEQPYQVGPQPTRILERVEIDFTKLDIFVVDDVDRFPIGRPTLGYGHDKCSGYPWSVDVGFEPGSYRSVMNCMLHGILPKVDTCALYGTRHPWLAFGLPEALVVDNGKAFIGNDLKVACGQLGILLEQMPIETGWFKGAVERFFRTNNTGLIHGLPGSSFSNVVERGDYDSIEHACISYSEFIRLLHIFLLDVYAQDRHTRLGIIPAHRWNEGLQAGFEPCLPPSIEELKMALYRTEWRTISRSGIDFECLRYQSPELARLRTSKQLKRERDADRSDEYPSGRVFGNRVPVRIKYDPGNLHQIYILDPDTQEPIPIPAVDPLGYTENLSLWKHRVIRRYARKMMPAPDIYDLADAKEHIQKIVDAAWSQTRQVRRRANKTNAAKTTTRTKVARYNEVGTGGLPTPETPSGPNPETTTVPEAQAAPPPESSVEATPEPTSTPDDPAPRDAVTDTTSVDQSGESDASAASAAHPRATRGRKKKLATVTVPASPALVPPVDLSTWSADYGLADS